MVGKRVAAARWGQFEADLPTFIPPRFLPFQKRIFRWKGKNIFQKIINPNPNSFIPIPQDQDLDRKKSQREATSGLEQTRLRKIRFDKKD